VKKILNLFGFSLLSMIACGACEKNCRPIDDCDIDTSIRWTNLGHDEALIVVSSDEELGNYVNGPNYPDIDFSRNTLLLISGPSTNGVTEVTGQLLPDGDDGYLFNVSVQQGIVGLELWMLAVTVPFVVREDQIKVNIHYFMPI
jgi:hypothetical protein